MINRAFSYRPLRRKSDKVLKNARASILQRDWRLPGQGIWQHACLTNPATKNHTRANEAQSLMEERRIYVLGIGNIGRLFAHSLARIPNRPPITLLFHRPSLVQDFKKAGETIEIVTSGNSDKQSGFEYEVIGAESSKEAPDEPIYNLILATKATQTLRALSAIKHRLTTQSTILLTQNGLGATSCLPTLFPTPSSQPSYLTAVVFHGINSTGPFSSVHAGVGFLQVAPTSVSTGSPDSFRSFLNTVLTLPVVNAIAVTPRELLIIQLEKVVINAIINPLTALFRIRNGELYDFPLLGPLISALVAETSAVVLALPELVDESCATRDRFGVRVLEHLVREKALMTGGNRSSMLQDVEEGKGETEIRFINGWVVEKGKVLGIGVELNERVVDMVEERRVVRLDEVEGLFGL